MFLQRSGSGVGLGLLGRSDRLDQCHTIGPNYLKEIAPATFQ